MSISVFCPNGHALQVKEAYAGKIGFCPHCRAQVQVPQPRPRQELSEEAILAFLGAPTRGPAPAMTEAALGWNPQRAPSPPKTSCGKCNREIPTGTHVCPFCRTYVAASSDF